MVVAPSSGGIRAAWSTPQWGASTSAGCSWARPGRLRSEEREEDIVLKTFMNWIRSLPNKASKIKHI